MSDTPPALSPEEWANGYSSHDLHVSLRPSMSTPGPRMYLQARSQPLGGALGDERDLHALAALCLYQQSFGFSQADVAGLNALATQLQSTLDAQGPAPSWDFAQDEIDGRTAAVAWVLSLAARIQSLLPPSTDGTT